jgi:prepilin peptidase CpaA
MPQLVVGCMILVLVASCITDLVSRRIPNVFTAPALAIALLLGGIQDGAWGVLGALGGLWVGFFMLLPLYIAGGTAAGDVKLLAVAGAYLGPTGAFFAGMFTFVAGAIFGLIWIAWNRFGAMALRQLAGTHTGLVAHLAHDSMSSSERAGSTIAYAPAILAGSVTAAWYQGLITIGG